MTDDHLNMSYLRFSRNFHFLDLKHKDKILDITYPSKFQMVCGYQQSNLYKPSLSEPYFSGEATFQKHRFSYLQTRHEPMV